MSQFQGRSSNAVFTHRQDGAVLRGSGASSHEKAWHSDVPQRWAVLVRGATPAQAVSHAMSQGRSQPKTPRGVDPSCPCCAPVAPLLRPCCTLVARLLTVEDAARPLVSWCIHMSDVHPHLTALNSHRHPCCPLTRPLNPPPPGPERDPPAAPAAGGGTGVTGC